MALVGGMLIKGTGQEPVRDTVVMVRGSVIKEAGSKGEV